MPRGYPCVCIMRPDDRAEWHIFSICCIFAIIFIWGNVILQHQKAAVWSPGHCVHEHELFTTTDCFVTHEKKALTTPQLAMPLVNWIY